VVQHGETSIYEDIDSHREIQTGDNTVITIEGHSRDHSTVNKYEQFSFNTSFYTKLVAGQVVAQEEEQMHVRRHGRELLFSARNQAFRLVLKFQDLIGSGATIGAVLEPEWEAWRECPPKSSTGSAPESD